MLDPMLTNLIPKYRAAIFFFSIAESSIGEKWTKKRMEGSRRGFYIMQVKYLEVTKRTKNRGNKDKEGSILF